MSLSRPQQHDSREEAGDRGLKQKLDKPGNKPLEEGDSNKPPGEADSDKPPEEADSREAERPAETDDLAEKLKEGGVESVPADDMDECSNERCAEIKGACGEKVGTCWVEGRCGGGGGQQVRQETPQIQLNPTQVHDQMGHPVCRC